MQKKYGFEHYNRLHDRDKPVVVFGCYGRGTKADIMNHRGRCIIVWSGSDSVRLHEVPHFVTYLTKNTHRIFHIAHSHWIQTDLKHWNIPYIDRVILPFDLSSFRFEPKAGNTVYHYGTHQREWYYGTHIMKKLRDIWDKTDKFPKVEISVQSAYNQRELYEIYKRSFVGVRLTEHDNMAMSVIEMGLMGRRSIFNGDVPCAIPYPCPPYDRYEPLTRRQWVWQDESLLPRIGKMILEMDRQPDRLLAEEMREFVHDDKEWLNTEYYENPPST